MCLSTCPLLLYRTLIATGQSLLDRNLNASLHVYLVYLVYLVYVCMYVYLLQPLCALYYLSLTSSVRYLHVLTEATAQQPSQLFS